MLATTSSWRGPWDRAPSWPQKEATLPTSSSQTSILQTVRESIPVPKPLNL